MQVGWQAQDGMSTARRIHTLFDSKCENNVVPIMLEYELIFNCPRVFDIPDKRKKKFLDK